MKTAPDYTTLPGVKCTDKEHTMAQKIYDYPHCMLNINHADAFPESANRSRPRQGDLIIKASSKQEAAEKLTHLGYRWMKTHELRIGMGDTLWALNEAGLLDSGDLFIVADFSSIVRVTLVDGEPVAEYFGEAKKKTVIVPKGEK